MVRRLNLVAGVLVAVLAALACKKGGAPAAATPTPTPNAAAAAAAAQELFKAMKMQNNLNDTTAAMIDSEISRNPGLTPYRDIMLQWLRKYMTWDAIQPEMTRMYTEAFTDEELKQMAAFYGSPAGQKSLEKLPDLMQRTAMAGARISQAHTDELRAAMAAKSEELKKEAAAGGGPGGPGGPGGAPGQGRRPARPQSAPGNAQPPAQAPAPAPAPTP
jgi:uncharacterized protein